MIKLSKFEFCNKINNIITNRIFILLLFAILFTFQLLFLDSDPSPIKRFGDIGDEGYWIHHARLKYIFGTFLPDELNPAISGRHFIPHWVYILQYLWCQPFFGEDYISHSSMDYFVMHLFYGKRLLFNWKVIIIHFFDRFYA